MGERKWSTWSLKVRLKMMRLQKHADISLFQVIGLIAKLLMKEKQDF